MVARKGTQAKMDVHMGVMGMGRMGGIFKATAIHRYGLQAVWWKWLLVSRGITEEGTNTVCVGIMEVHPG